MDDSPLVEFLEVMRRLRAECGWKRSQTHRSLTRYLLEETYETIEAIETGDADDLREELGDLLLQVYFHAVIAEQSGQFTLDDVATDVIAKMRRRNPHVFGGTHGEGHPALGQARAGDPASINEVWESIKAGDKRRTTLLEGVPATLPALLYADKALDRLQRQGSAVPGDAAAGVAALNPEDALGDRLLDLVAEARAAGVDPEQALRAAVRRRVDPDA